MFDFTGTNPIRIFKNIAHKPYVSIHGPEHHILDGASLLVAYKNAGGNIDIDEALEKHREVECLEYLMNSEIICVKGNCELYLDSGVQIDSDVKHLRDYYDDMREKLTAEQRNFIHIPKC